MAADYAPENPSDLLFRKASVHQLSGVDALHVLTETGDRHMHTIKLALLADGPAGVPSYDEVKAWVAEDLVRIPPLRWKVRKIPFGLGRPVFVDSGAYDVDRHMSAVELASPGGPEELDEVVSRIASESIDRAHPLWSLTYVTGLDQARFDGARVALVFKLHHAIMDGQASVRFLELAFDSDEPLTFALPGEPERDPTRGELIRFALASQARLYAQLPKVVRRTAASVRDNFARKKTGVAPTDPLTGPATHFNRWPLRERIYVDVTVPFADIKAIKDATGRTVNEVFVTLCGGAVRRYLADHGDVPGRCLNCAHPVSLRQPEERDNFGNRTSYWYVSLGTDIDDPLERLQAVKKSLDAAREWAKGDIELFAVWQDYYLLFGTLTLGSLSLAERLTKRPAFNAIVSNVRGPQQLSLRGAPVVAVRSMGPVTRVLGLNMTAWTYGDNFSVGLHSSRAFMPDLRRLADHLCDELDAFKKAVANLS
jgi:diacylglycerol O-acyltransferase